MQMFETVRMGPCAKMDTANAKGKAHFTKNENQMQHGGVDSENSRLQPGLFFSLTTLKGQGRVGVKPSAAK